MKILITGASGFVGSALLKRIKSNGSDEVSIIVRDRRNTQRYVEDLADIVYYGDINDLSFMKRVVSEAEPEVIYHLASSAIVRMCARDPVNAYQNNVMGTVNLLEAARSCGDSIKKVVVSTSDKVYGHASPPYDEETKFEPMYTYEATKACQDIACQNYYHNYEVPVCVVRAGNIYGPGDPNDSRIIPRSILNALSEISPVIYKDVADFKRDFVYIEDALNAFEVVAKKGAPGDAYCVGGGLEQAQKIQDIVVSILEKTKKTNLKIKNPERHLAFREIEEQYLDSSKIKKIGWVQKFTFDEGLQKTVDYYMKDLSRE